jgi:hypothetical protein
VKRDSVFDAWAQDVLRRTVAVLLTALDDKPEDLASPARRKVLLQKIGQLNDMRGALMALSDPDPMPADEEAPSELRLH